MQATSVFVADPKNARLVTGEKRRIGSSVIMLLVALILIAGAVVSGYFLYTRFSQHQAILTESKQTRGVITDGFSEITRSYVVIEIPRYHVEYRYTVGGESYEGSQDIDGALYDQLGLQSPVTVAYLPSNPGVAELAGDFADDTDFRNTMYILGAVTAVLAMLAADVLFLDLRNRRLSQGELLDGVLTSVIATPYRRALNVAFRYQFRSPMGTMLNGSRTIRRNDLKKKPLPANGTPVKVLYVNDKLHRIL